MLEHGNPSNSQRAALAHRYALDVDLDSVERLTAEHSLVFAPQAPAIAKR